MKLLLFWGIALASFHINQSIPDFCRLPQDEGTGSQFIFSVSYDAANDRCEPFLYKGEGGNANRFANERQCMRNCSANSEKLYPMDETEACHLEKAEGGCNGRYLRYYYDAVSNKCKKFFWTGCYGNGNRFSDHDTCHATCPGTPDFCRLPQDEGTGSQFIFSVSYDATNDRCEPFLYKGEGGNANRFTNERECIRNCSANSEKLYPLHETKACHLEKAEGGCNSLYLRYYYDAVGNECKKFLWTGCYGNGNRFSDHDTCHATCASTPDFCRLPQDEGTGSQFIFSVSYDATNDRCKPFLYKGEGGNANRFTNERQCIRNCSANSEKLYPMDETEACHLEKAEGGCSDRYLRYYYDAVSNKCKKFFWTGCYGNGNRFSDHDTCHATCPGTPDFCRLPQDEGTGSQFIFSVSYDATNDRCEPFLYKGEGGNANRFTNERECIRNCSANSEKLYPLHETKACHLEKAEGGCNGSYLRNYYDAVGNECKKFLWTGCYGNGNRFSDHDTCHATCASTPDFCRLPQDEGTGSQFIFSVSYDATNDRCKPFLYKGEGGNANRFTNERQCIRNCSANSEKLYPMDETEACHLEKAEGGCNGRYLRYYYDAVSNKCKKFFWTGCYGNGNRFSDHDTCHATCPGTPDFCRLPQDEGTGSQFIFSVSYDATNDRCEPFLYKGEGGNANRFTNERECIRNCSANSEKLYPLHETKACHLEKAEGGCDGSYLRYYYDAVSNKCKKFLWTGCYGNGNRFSDHDTCHATCASTPDFCRLPQDEGTGSQFIFSVSYDATNDRCEPFLYKGEGGNANRFTNERQCIRNCSANSEKLYPMDETEACHLEKAEGGCNDRYLRYYYDAVSNKCKKFFWTGCYGNGNRFSDHDTCHATCPGTPDFCRLPQDEGTGSQFIFSVSYDATNDRCEPFLYKGEGGNANRFTNERECIRNCSANSEKLYPLHETEACHLEKAEGGCDGSYLRYYYDAVGNECKKFLWTGCYGNGNRFSDHDTCHATCASTPDFCRLPQDEGTGSQFIFSVSYDATNDRCEPFLYKGEGGNANRFTNERQCIRNCSANSEKLYPMNETEACHLEKAEGGCNSLYLRYYYDAVYNKCKKFLWTGCYGNGNRFSDHDTCHATCPGTPGDGDDSDTTDGLWTQ